MLKVNGKKFEGATPVSSWTYGSDETVAAMIQAAHNGEISLKNYWSVGDTRKVQLTTNSISTMAGDTTTDFTPIQDQEIELVLVHSPSSNAFYGGGEFIVQTKNCLLERMYMNSTDINSGSFAGSALAENLNLANSNSFLMKLPDWLRQNLLDAQVITGDSNGTIAGAANIISTHKVFLPTEREIFGFVRYSNLTEFNALEQWTYYKTNANRIKKLGSTGSAYYWWERSPYYSNSDRFCSVFSSGSAGNSFASYAFGAAPCMLI